MKRRRREIPKTESNLLLDFSTDSYVNSTAKEAPTTADPHSYFKQKVTVKSAIISNLNHFTEYTIEVRACQDPNPNLTIEYCSLKAMTSVRTLPLGLSLNKLYSFLIIFNVTLSGGADDIDESTISVLPENSTESQMFRIKWDEPIAPNGFIVSYHLEYKKVSTDSVRIN